MVRSHSLASLLQTFEWRHVKKSLGKFQKYGWFRHTMFNFDCPGEGYTLFSEGTEICKSQRLEHWMCHQRKPNGACDRLECSRYCDDHPQCTHYYANIMGQCMLYKGCHE